MLCKFCCRSYNYCNCVWTEIVNTNDLFITKNKKKTENTFKKYKKNIKEISK